DIVTILGCVADADCGFGKICLHGTAGAVGAAGLPINGLCIDPNDKDRKGGTDGACANMLDTVRRYDVTRATRDTFTLQPHRDAPIRANSNPCSVKTGGTGGADGGEADGGAGGATGAGGADGGIVPNDCADNSLDPSTKNFECVTEKDDKGVAHNRCLQRCTKP